MLPKVSWLVASDPLILLFLTEHRWRLAANPSTIALNLGLSSSHVNRRLKELEKGGLVELADDRGYYRATDRGIQYILGNLSADELEKLAPED